MTRVVSGDALNSVHSRTPSLRQGAKYLNGAVRSNPQCRWSTARSHCYV